MAINYKGKIISLREYQKVQKQKGQPKLKKASIIWRSCWWLSKESPYDSFDWTILSEPLNWKTKVSFLNRRTSEIWVKTIDFKRIRLG